MVEDRSVHSLEHEVPAVGNLQLANVPAQDAVEVVVVRGVRWQQFVGNIAAEVDGLNHPGFDEGPNGAVRGRRTDAVVAQRFDELGTAQRTTSLTQHPVDRTTLVGHS
jgi:hypothetical protein